MGVSYEVNTHSHTRQIVSTMPATLLIQVKVPLPSHFISFINKMTRAQSKYPLSENAGLICHEIYTVEKSFKVVFIFKTERFLKK